MTLEDSTTYQAILKKGLEQGVAQGMAQGVAHGETQEARTMLQIQGRKRFGAASESVRSTLEKIDDTSRLERMAARIFDAQSWDDLLSPP